MLIKFKKKIKAQKINTKQIKKNINTRHGSTVVKQTANSLNAARSTEPLADVSIVLRHFKKSKIPF